MPRQRPSPKKPASRPARRFDIYRIDKQILKEHACEWQRILSACQKDPEAPVREFEEAFCRHIGRRYGVLVSSGSLALKVALKTAGIEQGDGVVVTNITHPSLLEAITYFGGRPVLVDIKESDLNMDEDRIEERIDGRTRFILAVDMFANPCAMGRIQAIARRRGLCVIEDASQAVGATRQGKKIGAAGTITAFSLSSYKPISAPGTKAGILLTDDKTLFERMRAMVSSQDLFKPALAALPFLFVKLKMINTLAARMKEINALYLEMGKKLKKGIRTFTPGAPVQEFPLFHPQRDRLKGFLTRSGIPLERSYTPLCLKTGEPLSAFPASDEYMKKAVHLPAYPLMTKEECAMVVRAVQDCCGKP